MCGKRNVTMAHMAGVLILACQLWGSGQALAVEALASEFVEQSVPRKMLAGHSYPVTVTLKNTGTATWKASEAYRLGSQNPRDNTTWGLQRVELAGDVATGQSATFNFTVRAPATEGFPLFEWRMVRDGVAWFGATTQGIMIWVVRTLEARNSQFVGQSVPAMMVAGENYPVSVVMRNTGAATWKASEAYRLGSQNPRDNTTWGVQRVGLAGDVATGQSATFNFTVRAPANIGNHFFDWKMVQDGVAWFGEGNKFATMVEVVAPQVLGHVDGVSGGNLNGWTCSRYLDRSIDVRLYALNSSNGNYSLVGTYPANRASEQAIASEC